MNSGMFYQMVYNFILNINFKRFDLFLDGIFIIPIKPIYVFQYFINIYN